VAKKTEQSGAGVGVVLCDCGGSLRKRLDMEKLRQKLLELDAVNKVSCTSRFCRQSECKKVTRAIANKRTQRIVIGACDRDVFDGYLTEAIAAAGINPGLVFCANIREHCAWVTKGKPKATEKANRVISAAVRRIRLAKPLNAIKVAVNQDVLIVGGGVSALQAAIALSDLGHRVTLVTSESSLGGQAAKHPDLYGYVAADSLQARSAVQTCVSALINRLQADKRITVRTNASLKSLEGELGNFTASLFNGTEQKINAGAVVLAVGSAPSVMGKAWSNIFENGKDVPAAIAIVTDVTCEQGRDVFAAVLSAAELLVKRFGARVKVFCSNIRVAATGMEALYRRARDAGVVFVKYEKPPRISAEGSAKVICVEEPTAGVELTEEFDLVIEADAPEPGVNERLISLINHLRPGPGRALQADNVWLLPTDTNREGIFVVGAARSNSELRDAQTDALAAAGEIHELLRNKHIEVYDDAAEVDTDKCVLCLTCLRICPHGAIDIDTANKAASVSAVTCKRCGICVTHCPADAIDLPGCRDEQLSAEAEQRPSVAVFACENSALPAATAAGLDGATYSSLVRLIRVPCAGRMDPREIVRTLEAGTEKVMVLACHPENCQYLSGSGRAAKRIERLNSMLQKAGIDKKRIVFAPLASVEAGRFIEYVKEI